MTPARESPRIRRLRSDHQALEQLRRESSILDFDTRAVLADPPHEYHIRLLGRGVWRSSQSADVALRESHEVTVRLGANYPRMMPELAWRSPIFHPNISSSGVVCLGGYGTFWAPSLNLDDLCGMLWDMVRYANFDVHSPYNREAALWAKTQTQFHFPFDPRPLRDRLAAQASPAFKPPVKVARHNWATPPEIQFLGEVIESEVIDAEIVDTAMINSVARGSPDLALRTTARSPESERPAVGGFGEVARPGPSASARPEILIIE